MTHQDLFYVEHIFEAIRDIEDSIVNLSFESFENLKDVKDACVRRIEIIGEAVKNISLETKIKYPEVKWKQIAGARDKIIHSYFRTTKMLFEHTICLDSRKQRHFWGDQEPQKHAIGFYPVVLDINLNLVWEMITQDIPVLKKQMQIIKNNLLINQT